eukprot:530411-Amphidinium_carterae.1
MASCCCFATLLKPRAALRQGAGNTRKLDVSFLNWIVGRRLSLAVFWLEVGTVSSPSLRAMMLQRKCGTSHSASARTATASWCKVLQGKASIMHSEDSRSGILETMALL